MVDALEPARGVRNANPGNIRYNSRNKWQGAATPAYDEQGFCRFVAPEWGIRAIVRTLLSYDRRGLNSVRAIVSTWAPGFENDTASYVRHVAQKLGVHPDDTIDVDSFEVMRPLVETIIVHENGRQPYKPAVIAEGLRLGGVFDAPPPPKPAMLTQAASTVASGLAAASLAAPAVKEAADGLEPFLGSPWIAKASVALVTLAGLLTLAGAVAQWLRAKRGL